MTAHRSINALAESFFATYKLELIEPADLAARSGTGGDGALAGSNLQPTAPALGHRHTEPVDYEERYWDRRAAA